MSAGYRDPGAPQGRVIPLARPNIMGLFGGLALFFGLILAVGLGFVFGASPVLAMPMTFVLLGVALWVVGFTQSRAERSLVLDPRGVFVVNTSGVVEGMVGAAPLTVVPGHYLYRAKYSAYEKQCVMIGNHFSIGTNAIGNVRYRVPVQQMPLPQYYLKSADWDEFVGAVPALRAIQ